MVGIHGDLHAEAEAPQVEVDGGGFAQLVAEEEQDVVRGASTLVGEEQISHGEGVVVVVEESWRHC